MYHCITVCNEYSEIYFLLMHYIIHFPYYSILMDDILVLDLYYQSFELLILYILYCLANNEYLHISLHLYLMILYIYIYSSSVLYHIVLYELGYIFDSNTLFIIMMNMMMIY